MIAKKKAIAKKNKSTAVKKSNRKTSQKSLIELNLPEPQKVEAWGMNSHSISPVLKPKSEEEIASILEYANSTNSSIAFRGGGCSYGDAAINSQGMVVDLSDYNRILSFDEKTGILHAESGATIQQIWEFCIEKSFWPPVVSGTMYPTLGGALSMNIHGKNNFSVGTLGEHVLEFTFLSASGKKFTCSPKTNSDIYYSAISGFGMLGCFLEIKLKMKKIYSGKMKVWPVVTRNFQEMFDYFEAE